MSSRSESGKAAEERAVSHLAQRGYRIRDRNWRGKRGELDIIAEEGEVICFVEVRHRGRGARVTALESVDARKRGRLVATAHEYLLRHRLIHRRARFDVIGFSADGTLRHIEGAFTT